jgi:hypothetical protein
MTTSSFPLDTVPANSQPRVPLLLKLLYTAFVAVMVPYYWRAYGPRNFLYFCDVAVLVTFVGIWLESSLLISMEAVAILLPQTIWLLDIGARLLGFRLLGLTDYMFNPKYSLFVRCLSLFHGWLPLLLIYLLYKLGYDRRALWMQTIAGVGLLLICYFGFFAPLPHVAAGPRVANINYVFGFNEDQAQTKFPPLEWLAFLLIGIPTILYIPTHFALRAVFQKPRSIS